MGEMKQIHTLKGPFDKPVFLHKAPSIKSTSPPPPLFHQENDTQEYQFINYSGSIY